MARDTARRKLPAYAKALADARRQNMVPLKTGYGHVAVVVDWRTKSTASLPRLVCSNDDSIDLFDFSCLAGLDVLLPFRAEDAPRAAEAVAAILAAGASGVWAWNLSLVDEFDDATDADQLAQLYRRAQSWHAGSAAWPR